MSSSSLMPDLLFEVSWEVCNKVGGIHTVITSKAPTLVDRLADAYVTIGPWLLPQADRPLPFVEESGHDDFIMACREAGVPVRVGRWDIPGHPLCVLVSFATLYEAKDGVLAGLWERSGVDSLHGGWDYIEPVLFGQAAAIAIERWCRTQRGEIGPNFVAHFHEWLTGAGLLYLADQAPAIGTVFTTHATVVGRAVAGNDGSLPALLHETSPEALAQGLGVSAKHSLECAAARGADVFTTVSGITADEAELLFDRRPDPITPNGIDLAVIDALAGPQDPGETRRALLALAEQLSGAQSDDALLVATSGRYEFHNKGYDVLLDAAARLNRQPGPPLLLYMLVPAGHSGLRPDLNARRQDPAAPSAGPLGIATHILHDPEGDPIAARCRALGLANAPGDRVKIIHVPIYLSEVDGLLNLPYEAVLRAVDLTCFVSDYEPWGYTPQESLALGVPTITSDHAGFGRWCVEAGVDAPDSVEVLSREGADPAALVTALAARVDRLAAAAAARAAAGDGDGASFHSANRAIAARTDWRVFFGHYESAYAAATHRAAERGAAAGGRRPRPTVPLPVRSPEAGQRPRLTPFDVAASLPTALKGLQRLAQNLWWTWDPQAGALFAGLDEDLWRACGHNPVLLLRRLAPERLEARAAEPTFVAAVAQTLARLDAHLATPVAPPPTEGPGPDGRIAYFCAEFGLHPSLPIYSGGLGVLAGDCLKAADDLGLPLVAVGLFYRAGYLRQGITAAGDQVARDLSVEPGDLPLEPVAGPDGRPLQIVIEMPGLRVALRAWRVAVGRIPLYLLDSDLPSNPPEARAVTRQLYGGDQDMRLKQEIILGKGGARLLTRLGIRPSVYHLNEGHAALVGLERIADLMHGQGQSFETALTIVRASTVFTTHTPVPAGHDRFAEDVLRRHFGNATDWLGLPWERFLALGRSVDSPGMFNMSGLAFRSAAVCNAVSDLHREVSQSLLHSFTPARLENEVPVIGITNGVHLASWTAPEICRLLGAVDRPVRGQDFAAGAAQLDSAALWGARSALRARLLDGMRVRLTESFRRRHDSAGLLRTILDGLDEDALVIGFARRFAPYKRVQLLLAEPERLVKLLSDVSRPVRLVVAGKAHPNDVLGQELLRRVAQAAREPALAGRLFFLEDHDIALARLLVQGSDVWLNTPIHRLEASGTSGMKAAANGGINLSILDGWWAEGYDGGNGWAIGGRRVYGEDSQDLQDDLDGAELLRLLEDELLPTYFNRDATGRPEAWLERVRRSLATIPPAFDAARMVSDYQERAYRPLATEHALLAVDGYAEAERRSARSNRLRSAFNTVAIRDLHIGDLIGRQAGDLIPVRSSVQLGALGPDDVVVEFVMGRPAGPARLDDMRVFALEARGELADGSHHFETQVPIDQVGSFAHGLRVRARDHGTLDDLVLWA